MPDDGQGLHSRGDQPTEWADAQLQRFVAEGAEIPPDMAEEQKAVLLKPGDVVAERFEVAEQLGFGGMGAVYKVTDRMTGQDRALKVMLPSLLKSDAARERFVAEVTISQELSHEGIVRVHDLGEDTARGFRFFTMEYIEGKTLHRVLSERGGKLPVDEALSITRQICDALEYAHRTTIHRDLKPQNVMVRPDGRVKVLDFGLAKLMSPGRLTKSSMALGTAYYQAPEQSVHLKELDPRADIYSLGVMLYEMLTGELPLGMAKPPSQVNAQLPKWLDDPVARCLESKPEGRYPDVTALREALGGKVKAARRVPMVPVVTGVVALFCVVIGAALFVRWREEPVTEEQETLAPESFREPERGRAISGFYRPEPSEEPPGRSETSPYLIAHTAPGSRPSEETTGRSETSPRYVSRMPRRTEPLAGTSGQGEVTALAGAEVSALSTEEAQRLQRETAPDGEITKTVDLGDGVTMEFMWIPPGEFMMGSPDSDEDAADSEKPRHKVTISRGFWLGKHEVTQKQWETVMGDRPSHVKGDGCPVEQVSWEQCQKFVETLDGGAFRLPTEAEWEYACRAGSNTRYCFGDDEKRVGEYAWHYEDEKSGIRPVGQKKPNAWGLHDMYGNVREWCQDWYGTYSEAAATDPRGPSSGEERVVRGGGYTDYPKYCSSANRAVLAPDDRCGDCGFRLALDRRDTVPALSTEEAQCLQRETAPNGQISKTADLGDGVTMEFMWIPPGEFMMGSPDSDEDAKDDEKPRHKVTISKGFWMGKYEVTEEQWALVYPPTNPDYTPRKRPASAMPWNACQEYLQELGRIAGSGEFRLPTEAEWEYACRAGTTGKYFFGDDEDLKEYARFLSTSGGMIQGVGGKKPNPWGLHDMLGNVWEWCSDWYAADYYRNSPGIDPAGPASGETRVTRGGSWGDTARSCRPAGRHSCDPAIETARALGFRVVLSPDLATVQADSKALVVELAFEADALPEGHDSRFQGPFRDILVLSDTLQHRGFDVVVDKRALELERQREAAEAEPDDDYLAYIDACMKEGTLSPKMSLDPLPSEGWEWARERPKKVGASSKGPRLPTLRFHYARWVRSPVYTWPGSGASVTVWAPEVQVTYSKDGREVWHKAFVPEFPSRPTALSSTRNQIGDAMRRFFDKATSWESLATLGEKS